MWQVLYQGVFLLCCVHIWTAHCGCYVQSEYFVLVLGLLDRNIQTLSTWSVFACPSYITGSMPTLGHSMSCVLVMVTKRFDFFVVCCVIRPNIPLVFYTNYLYICQWFPNRGQDTSQRVAALYPRDSLPVTTNTLISVSCVKSLYSV